MIPAFAACFAAAVVMTVPPHVLLAAIFIATPLSFGGTIPPIAAVGSADLLVQDPLIVAFLIQRAIARRRLTDDPRLLRAGGATLLFLAWNVMITAAQVFQPGGDAVAQLTALARMSVLHVLFVTLVFLPLSRARTEWLLKFCYVAGICLALTIPLQIAAMRAGIVFGDFIAYPGGGGRYSGLLGDPNQAAIFAALPLFAALLRYSATRRTRHAVIAGTLLICMVLTGTRGPLIMVGITSALILYRTIGAARTTAVLAGFLLATVALSFWDDQVQVVIRRSQGAAMQAGLAGRQQPLIRALTLISERPLFGYGFAGHGFHAASIADHTNDTNLNGTYNQSLEVWINGGLVNLLLFLWMIRAAIRSVSPARLAGEPATAAYTMCRAAFLYMLSLAALLHTDLWLLPGATVGYQAFIVAALATRYAAPVPVPAPCEVAYPATARHA